MAPKASALLHLLSLIPVLFTTAAAAATVTAAPAFNITKILSAFPDFSAFNDLLTQTKIADEVNHRVTITVLVLDSSAVNAISSLPADVQKRVLAVHVLLDYFDGDKINKMDTDNTTITTLYQTTGTADQRQGYVTMKEIAHGVKLGSSMPGAPLDSELIKVIYAKPYNISVLQIGKAIIPPGIEQSTGAVRSSSPSPLPSPPPAAAKAPKAATPKAAPTPKAAKAPVAATPTADSPNADAPVADSPVADGPVADAPNGESKVADDDVNSGAGHVALSVGTGAVALAALMLSI